MDEKSSKQPLLSRNDQNLKPSPNFLVSSTKWFIKVAIWLIFIAWAALVFLYPSDVVHSFYLRLLGAIDTPVFGTAGTISMSTCFNKLFSVSVDE